MLTVQAARDLLSCKSRKLEYRQSILGTAVSALQKSSQLLPVYDPVPGTQVLLIHLVFSAANAP